MRQYHRFAAALAFTLIAAPVTAADYRAPTIDAPSMIPAEEIGTGWYLRGDVGYVRNAAPQSEWRDDRFSDTKAADTASFGLGIGYKYNEWLRVDATADHIEHYGVRGVAPCRNPGCLPGDLSRERTELGGWALMANGYVDFGNWAGITPYVGGGIGAARIVTSRHDSFNPGSKTPNGTFAAGDRWSFAASAMAGASYDLGSGFQIDAGYRYLWIDGAETGTSSAVKGRVEFKDLDSHQVRIGVRYFVY